MVTGRLRGFDEAGQVLDEVRAALPADVRENTEVVAVVRNGIFTGVKVRVYNRDRVSAGRAVSETA